MEEWGLRADVRKGPRWPRSTQRRLKVTARGPSLRTGQSHQLRAAPSIPATPSATPGSHRPRPAAELQAPLSLQSNPASESQAPAPVSHAPPISAILRPLSAGPWPCSSTYRHPCLVSQAPLCLVNSPPMGSTLWPSPPRQLSPTPSAKLHPHQPCSAPVS